MDIVLGAALSPDTVRLVVIEGQNADGVTVDQDAFDVGGDSTASGAVDHVIAAISGTRESAGETGFELVSTGVTWTDAAQAGALRDAVAAHDLGAVMLVSPLLAAAALAQTVGASICYGHIAMLFVEPTSATLAVVEVADGSIVDLHRHQLDAAGDAASELAAMVAGLDEPGSRADGVFLIGCGTDIVPLKPALDAATSLEVTAPEEPDMALARGAALASANAPLFASTTAAMAYALDPGTGEMNPRALAPTYLDITANADRGSDALAYSAVEDDGTERVRRGGRPVLLAGSAVAAVSLFVGGALAVSLTSDRPTSAERPAPPPAAAPPSQPPQAQAPVPTAPAPPPAPTAQAAAPPPPALVEQPAPPPTMNAAPAPPVHRAPPRRAPEYVPTPVQRAAPAPEPAGPPPEPPAAPAPPPAAPQLPPQQPAQPPLTMYLHFPFVTVPIPITPPAPPPPPAP